MVKKLIPSYTARIWILIFGIVSGFFKHKIFDILHDFGKFVHFVQKLVFAYLKHIGTLKL